MKKFNIMAAKPYTDNQGVEKTKWVKIGSMVEMVDNQGNTKRFGDFDAVPTGAWFDGSIQFFEQDQQQGQGGGGGYQQPQQQQGGYNAPQNQQAAYNAPQQQQQQGAYNAPQQQQQSGNR